MSSGSGNHLRPEHLRLAPAANRHLAAEVCHIEALGNEQLLACRLKEGGHLALVRTGPEQAVTTGQEVRLEVDPSGWRLFDATGEGRSRRRAARSPIPAQPGEASAPLPCAAPFLPGFPPLLPSAWH